MDNILNLLGSKWESGARGPVKFDCWGLVCHFYSIEKGILLPQYIGVKADCPLETQSAITTGLSQQSQFIKLSAPEDHCIVGMSKNRQYLNHVGVFINLDGGLVLHTTGKTGVILQTLSSLRNSKWSRIEFYRYLYGNNN